MPEALSVTEVDRQHIELLPGRTVMSIVTGKGSGDAGQVGNNNGETTTTATNGSGAGDIVNDALAFLNKIAPTPFKK